MPAVAELSLASFAHDIKNPVALIKANVDYISAFGLGGQVGVAERPERNLNVINKEITRIISIVDNFISDAKDGYIQNAPPVNVFDVVSEALAEIAAFAKTSGRSFRASVETTLDVNLCARVEYDHLYSMLANIYKNAIEATQKTPRPRVTTRVTQRDKMIAITITDNGEGIDTTFRPFVTTKKGGSGVGVAAITALARRYGGGFTLENALEGGCVATLTLPLEKS
jgi:C4-dicarboxylate-specific signal transduction histidine kinase